MSNTIFITKISTNQSLDLGPCLQNNAGANPGDAMTSLVFNSTGLTCTYRKGATGVATDLPLVIQTVAGAHTDGGFVAINTATMPGVYRLDLPDTVFNSSFNRCAIMLAGFATLAPYMIHIVLLSMDLYNSVNAGLTRLTGYTDKNVFVDVVDGVAGTVVETHGVEQNPVNTMTDAQIIATAINSALFTLAHNTTTVLDQAYLDSVFTLIGSAVINLNNKDITGSRILGGTVAGVTTGGLSATDSILSSVTSLGGDLQRCKFVGTITIAVSTKVIFNDCSDFAALAPATINVEANSAQRTYLILTNYHGRLQIGNLQSGDIIVITGNCTITLLATCVGGTIELIGDVRLTNLGSGMTINRDDNTAAIAALDVVIAAQVEAGLNAPIPELPVGVPIATPSLRTGLMLEYMAMRNQLITRTGPTNTFEIYNDAQTKIADKVLTDVGGVYKEGPLT